MRDERRAEGQVGEGLGDEGLRGVAVRRLARSLEALYRIVVACTYLHSVVVGRGSVGALVCVAEGAREELSEREFVRALHVRSNSSL